MTVKNKRLWGLLSFLAALGLYVWLPAARPVAGGVMFVGLFVLIRGKLG